MLNQLKFVFLKSVLIFLIIFSSCQPPEPMDFEAVGYKPIYVSYSNAYNISKTTPTSIVSSGKIYIKDSIVYITETNKGIHVINYKNPSDPVNESFINIYGNVDIAIKGNFMYANNLSDLIVIDLTKSSDILVKRVKNAFPKENSLIPSVTNQEKEVWFECPDTTKGIIVGWQKTNLKNPKCKVKH